MINIIVYRINYDFGVASKITSHDAVIAYHSAELSSYVLFWI